MEPRVSVITLGVRDLEASKRFYRDGLGLPLQSDDPDVAFFLTKGTVLALYPRDRLAEDVTVPDDGHGFSGITLAHNVRSKEEVRLVLEEAQRAGAQIVKAAQDTFWGGHSGYFRDLDGYYWEVAWNPFLPLE